MNIVNNILNETLVHNSSKTRFIANTNNLKVNGILFDLSFTVPDDVVTPSEGEGGQETRTPYGGKWDFTRDIFVTVALRLGSGNGSAVNLISSCSLYQLLAYSDYIAGVSMNSTEFIAGQKVRISGAIPIGFFSMGSRDSLDVIVNVGDVSTIPTTGVNVSVGAIYQSEMASSIITYQSAKPTGAMQNYTNVTALYYDGEQELNKEVTVIEQLGGQNNVNIEDAIALSNAQGRFEFFTRFGRLYQDVFDLSQDISFKCPVDDAKAEVLIVGYHFDDSLLVSNASESEANRNALIAMIKENDSAKYNYLLARGLVS